MNPGRHASGRPYDTCCAMCASGGHDPLCGKQDGSFWVLAAMQNHSEPNFGPTDVPATILVWWRKNQILPDCPDCRRIENVWKPRDELLTLRAPSAVSHFVV